MGDNKINPEDEKQHSSEHHTHNSIEKKHETESKHHSSEIKKEEPIHSKPHKETKKLSQKNLLIIAGVIVAILAITVLVIKFGHQNTMSTNTNTNQPTQNNANSNDVAAVVNGVNLYSKDIDELYSKYSTQIQQGMTRESFINQTIARELILQDAEKNGVTISDDEVNKIIDGILAQNGMTRQQFEAQVVTQGLNESQIVAEYKKQLLVNKMLNVTVYSKVTDAEVEQFYNNNLPLFDTVQASHILVNTSAEAVKLIGMLNKGANFADLAKNYSIDTGSAVNGGELGYFSRGTMVKEFEDAAFAMNVSQITKTPVKTQYGYHIIKVTAKKRVTLADAKSQIVNAIVSKDHLIEKYINSLWKTANVTIYG